MSTTRFSRRHKLVVAAIMSAAACRPSAVNEAAGTYVAPDADARRSRTSATETVQFTDEDRYRFSRVELMIQGRFPGVQVYSTNGGYAVRIRGKSPAANNEPLIVIDGMICQATGCLGTINPGDVDRITIIKDGAAAIYGIRGGNGVIEVTTRRRSSYYDLVTGARVVATQM